MIILIISSILAGIYIPKIRETIRIYNTGEIVIQKDNDFFNRYQFSGSGTSSDPYRIENLVINTNLTYGIRITHTTAYFIIKNCSINSLRSSILISHINSENAKIISNTLGSISISNSHGCLISNNTCQSGIFVSDSHNTLIVKNYCSYIEIVKDNIPRILNNRIINNICSSINEYLYSGIFLFGGENTIISGNICFNNYYGIFITVSYNSYIYNNTCYLNTEGIMQVMGNSIFIRNTCYLNNESGITVGGINNFLFYNNCSKNEYGLVLYYNSEKNVKITYNVFSNNTLYGILIKQIHSNSFIHHNNFLFNYIKGLINNSAQAYQDDSTSNNLLWYDPSSLEGNYWSDLIWNEGVIYEIDGGSNTDPYPLENPVEI